MALVVYSTDAEALWNGFRLGVFALKAGDQVKAFLFARGVECESHAVEPFNVKQMMQAFVDAGGEILACGTCLKLRNSHGTELCPLSTMKDLYELIRESDKVVSI
ncbi:MAG: sulfur reduction protein DsrE [Lentisphaerae bacterium GWF2_57_35]|nr:MAG: sulfur reduction protein DsrE [Lentisphaerae bacterium GWF2_57_35]